MTARNWLAVLSVVGPLGITYLLGCANRKGWTTLGDDLPEIIVIGLLGWICLAFSGISPRWLRYALLLIYPGPMAFALVIASFAGTGMKRLF